MEVAIAITPKEEGFFMNRSMQLFLSLVALSLPLQAGFWSKTPNITTTTIFADMAGDLKKYATAEERLKKLKEIEADIDTKQKVYPYIFDEDLQKKLIDIKACVDFFKEFPLYQDKVEETKAFYSELRPNDIPWLKDLTFKAKDHSNGSPDLATAQKIVNCDSCKKVFQMEEKNPEKFKRLNDASIYLFHVRSQRVNGSFLGIIPTVNHVPLDDHLQIPGELRRQAGAFLICNQAKYVVNKETTPASKYIK